MEPGTHNITIRKGATFRRRIAVTGIVDDDGVDVDMSVYSARAKIATALGTTPTYAFTVSNETKGSGSYALTLSLTPAQTVTLTVTPEANARAAQWGFWDLEFYTALDAIVLSPLEGTVTLSLEATT